MLKRAGSDFRSKVSGRMMFIYAVVLIAFFGISIPAAAINITVIVCLPSEEIIQFEIKDIEKDYMDVNIIKSLINKKTGISPESQHLYSLYYPGGRELEDNYLLLRIYSDTGNCLVVELRVDGSYPPAPEPTTEPVYEDPVFYALPEDEIGAYAIRQDGTKEYLLFHTYDICMDWLASDELCAGFERCFHKDGK